MLLQAYTENWVNDFSTLKSVLTDALTGLAVTIEHVGSTSVPGLAAKPIIDIDIVFFNAEFEEIKKRLEQIGYYHNGNQGIVDREVFKRNPTTVNNEVLDSIAHHLYVCPQHSEELQRHILFRNQLIENKKARLDYEMMKYEAANEANNDRKIYAALKEIKSKDFIDTIVENAKRY